MKHKWAPWRMEYIEQMESRECIFCKYEKSMLVHEDREFVIIMNKYPYNNGHIMVSPKQHGVMLEDLEMDIASELMQGIGLAVKAVKRALNPDGINVGINMGREAGAGIADHLHVHIVPRWNGDTNFMPVLCDTKLISEGMERTRQKIKRALSEIEHEKTV